MTRGVRSGSHRFASLKHSPPSGGRQSPRRVKLVDLLRGCTAGEVARIATRKLVQWNHSYLVYTDLRGLPPVAPRKLGAGILRPLDPTELDVLYDRFSELTLEDRLRLVVRIRFYRAGFTNCWVLDDGGEIAYLHWMIYPSENELIRSKYRRTLRTLAEHEVMIEYAFCFPSYRGRGYMPYVAWELLNQARAQGYRRGLTYVRTDNLVALNALTQMGFRHAKIGREVSLLGSNWRTL